MRKVAKQYENRKFKVLRQTTYETCLPCTLLMITSESKKYELDIWKRGWKFNYLIGQLNYVAKKFNIKLDAYIENRYYFNELQTQKNKNICLINSDINLSLVRKLLGAGPVILYLDCFYLQGVVHAPHFVVVTRSLQNNFEIADPADGKLKLITNKIINQAIKSLRNRFKYSPVLVQIHNKQ